MSSRIRVPLGGPWTAGPTRIQYRNMSMANLLSRAYGVKFIQPSSAASIMDEKYYVALVGSGWGYSRCATYALLDQSAPMPKPILSTGAGYTANEVITAISGTYAVKTNTANTPVNNDGNFYDRLVLANSRPIPAGTKSVQKQVITIIDTTNGTQNQMRVNCPAKLYCSNYPLQRAFRRTIG